MFLLAPFMAWLWVALEKHRRDLPTIGKFCVGLLGMALGFLVMVGATKVLAATGSSGPMWLVMTYFLHTIGELALSPVGMSATTRLAPKRFTGQAMGLWFTSLALGNLLASRLAGSLDGATPAETGDYFQWMFWFGVIAALALAATYPLLKNWANTGK